MDNLQKQILATTVYFDCFDYPLTLEEIHKFLINLEHLGISSKAASLEEIEKTLQNVGFKSLIFNDQGFYYLKGRGNLPELRKSRSKTANIFLRKMQTHLNFFAAIPFIRGAALSGSLAIENVREDSDWDLFFLIDKKRLYLSSLLISLLAVVTLRKWQRWGFKNIFCLNHFVAYPSGELPSKSVYEAAEFLKMIPLYQEQNSFDDFLHSNKLWMGDYFCFVRINRDNAKVIKLSEFSLKFKKIQEVILGGFFGDILESWARSLVSFRINRSKSKFEHLGRIIIDDQQIEYHPDSPQVEIIKNYNQTMTALGFPDLAQEKDSGFYLMN